MRVFDESKAKELKSYDLEEGYLKPDKLFIAHHEAVEAVAEQGHYEVVAEYPNGGKDVDWIVDIPGVEAKEAYDEEENIYVFTPFTEEEKIERLRYRRERECFTVIDRSVLWHNRLTEEQKTELDAWYQAWLNVTETKVIPEKPAWLEEV